MKLNRNPELGHLPGENGWPIVGSSVELLKDPIAFFKRQHEQYGPISRSNIGGYKNVVLIGPAYMQELMLDQSQNYSAEGGWGAMMPDLFKGSVLVRDFDEHRLQRRIMQTAFKTETLRQYVPHISAIVERAVVRWQKAQQVLFFNEAKRLLLEIAFDIFCYVEASAAEREAVNRAFTDMMEGALAYVRVDLPGFLYHRAMRGRRFLENYFLQQIEKKRQGDHQDAFTYFCKERKENGDYFSNQEIADHMVFLMLAAHDTTASAITMAAYYLGNSPALQQQLSDEANQFGCALTLDTIRHKLPLLESVFHETLRLHPAVSIKFRSTLRACVIDDQPIPANTLLVAPTLYNHRMEKWWPDPQVFKPERFTLLEHKQHSFQWTPFGGGAHKCIGLNFAEILFKTVFATVLRTHRIEFAKRNYYPAALQHFPFTKPMDSLPLKLSNC